MIRENQAIHAEVIVVRVIAVVTAVFIERTTLFILCQNAVVTPFPDKMSLNGVMTVKHCLIFTQSARPVAHGVGIFTDNARFRVRIFTEFIHHLHAGIHGADDIHHIRITIFFIVDQTGVINGFCGIIHGTDITAVTGFITERPHNHGRMVFLCMHLAADAVDIHRLPGRIIGDLTEITDVGKTVGFHIGFRHHKQAVNIAQLIKARIVRVVRGTDSIDIVLFHQPQILLHPADADSTAFVFIIIVAVDAV